jgi:hypothetical protein
MSMELRTDILEALEARIEGILAECAVAGWSGDEDSKAVRRESAEAAKRFVSLLEFTRVPLPEVIPEPDGDLALEWHRDASHWVIASFRPDGSMNYASRSGEGRKATGTGAVTRPFARIIDDYLALVFAE